MSFSLSAFRFFFRSARSWRKKRSPSIPQLDALMERVTRLDHPLKTGMTFTEIAGVSCAVIGEEYRPSRCILYIHGGGFGLCSISTHYRFVKYLSDQAKSCVIFPEYTKIPFANYPVQLDQCGAVYKALRSDADSAELTLMGDSAGGNLATVILNDAVAAGEALPDKVVLLCPWLDLTNSSFNDLDDITDQDEVDGYARHYAGETPLGHHRISPASQVYAIQKPTLILATSNELFHPVIRQFCEANKSEYLTYVERTDLFHVWPLFTGLIPESTRDARLIAAFIETGQIA